MNEFVLVLLLTLGSFGLFLSNLVIAKWFTDKVDTYYLNHPDSKTAKLFNRKPFKCNLCMSCWITLINFAIMVVIFKNTMTIPLLFTLFFAVFFLQWREENNSL